MPRDFVPQKILTVSEINARVHALVESSFARVLVRGEISNFKTYPSGHFYFTLKDAGAQLTCVMFRGYNRMLKFRPEDGMLVVAAGRLTVYEARGQYQMVMDGMDPDGVGALQIAFEQLKKKLAAEGLFDGSRKKRVPFLPGRIGVITSDSGAAVHDILTVVHRRFPDMPVLLYPVRVQGDGAVKEIVQALDFFSGQKNADVVILGRGGGSLEDLWAFNEEAVARAIFRCSVPVISAVGHETDFTIADFVADLRAATPSAAAELAVPEKHHLLLKIQEHKQSLAGQIGKSLQNRRRDLSHLVKLIPEPRHLWESWRLKLADHEDKLHQIMVLGLRHRKMHLASCSQGLHSPARLIESNHAICRHLIFRLAHVLEKLLTHSRHRREQFAIRLELLSPKQVLKRGYVMARRKGGEAITHAGGLLSGDEMQLMFFDGEVGVRVK